MLRLPPDLTALDICSDYHPSVFVPTTAEQIPKHLKRFTYEQHKLNEFNFDFPFQNLVPCPSPASNSVASLASDNPSSPLNDSPSTSHNPSDIPVASTAPQPLDSLLELIPTTIESDSAKIADGLASPWVPRNLTRLSQVNWHCEWFGALPRSLLRFDIIILSGAETSPLTQNGDLFEALPSGLQTLTIRYLDSYANQDSDFCSPEYSPSSFSSLQSLITLEIPTIGLVHSRLLRVLPRSIRHLSAAFLSIEEEDAAFIHPAMRTLHIGSIVRWDNAPYLIKYWPIRCISYIRDKVSRAQADKNLPPTALLGPYM